MGETENWLVRYSGLRTVSIEVMRTEGRQFFQKSWNYEGRENNAVVLGGTHLI